VKRLTDVGIAFLTQKYGARGGGLTVYSEATEAELLRLKEMPWLTELTLFGKEVTPAVLAGLTALPKLESLTLNDYPASDLSALKPLTGLRDLGVYKPTSLTDLSALESLPRLERLSLCDASLDDVKLATLGSLPNLAMVKLWSNAITTLKPLEASTKIKRLYCDYNPQLRDISAVARMPELDQVGLDGTPVSDLAPFKNCPKLCVLVLRGTQVTDLGPLAGLANLTVLHLPQTKVTDLGPLASVTALADVDVQQTGVADVTPLKGLVNLTSVVVARTPVKDLAPLAGLTKLTRLDASGTQVTQVAALNKLEKLRYLSVPKAVPAEEVKALQAALPKIKVTQQ
jgi:internalin A